MKFVIQETEIFEAADGKQFTNRAECEAYEQSYFGVMRNMFNALPCKQFKCCEADYNLTDDSQYVIVTPHNLEELTIINMCLKYYREDSVVLTLADLNVPQVLYINYDNEVYYEMPLTKKIDTYLRAFGWEEDEPVNCFSDAE